MLSTIMCFNTSYVSVQVLITCAFIIIGTGFNTSYVSVQDCEVLAQISRNKKFQYIICVGSSIIIPLCDNAVVSFNTSYVSVQVTL